MKLKPFVYKANKVCSRCIMDDTVQGITFNEKGECTLCQIHDEIDARFPLNQDTTKELENLVSKIRKDGIGKKYDCIVGVSGGRDSTYTLYSAVKLGLRPLAVHFDNGWNSELAVQNIKNACKKLNIDLYTHVADWEEFKDMQKAFLYASVPDAEVPTDWVIYSVLYKVADMEGVKYIIHGHSYRTEGTSPLSWTYMDGKYVNYIQKKFGTKKIKSFPVMTMREYINYSLVKKINQVRLLYYLPYDEKLILEMLKNELEWQDYGGKHHESKYTGFFQSYILTRKFNIDKRKLHYSALVRSGQMNRNSAFEKIQTDPYTGGIETYNYCLKKLDLTEESFEEIMETPPKTFLDYKSYYPLIKSLKRPFQWGTKVGIIPDTVYRKYFKFTL